MKHFIVLVYICAAMYGHIEAQPVLAKTPPMGFMTWNFFGINITEQDIKSIADAMVENGLKDVGYEYIFIDDGWQGGRDNRNNIIPDSKKFPGGMRALADYVHSKGLKLGIYSDAAPLTCGGYTASLHFEEQDARTFASWGIDYLKYDYCGAPADWITAITRYSRMAEALKKSGREIMFSLCEWGDRSPWIWGRQAGGQLWRTTADIRDKWKSLTPARTPGELHGKGAGIIDVVNINSLLHSYAGPGGWNDPDMLIIGLYGKKGAPSSDLGGTGCTDVEYQSQMSLWCMMAAPLMVSCDIRHMNNATSRILLNREIIRIDQDALGAQAVRKVNNDSCQVFIKPLANGDVAMAALNTSDKEIVYTIPLADVDIKNKTTATDLWSQVRFNVKNKLTMHIAPHETKVYRLYK